MDFKGAFMLHGELVNANEATAREVLRVTNPHDGEKGYFRYNVHTVLRKIEHNGALVLAETPSSLNPAESFLTIVLAFTGRQYATWEYNHQTKSCHSGHHFGGDYSKACADFMERSAYTIRAAMQEVR